MQLARLKRREFIRLLWGVGAAWPLAAHAQNAAKPEPREFRAIDTQSKDHPTARALVHMSELLSDRTHGRHRLMVYPGGLLGEQEESFEQMRAGGIDINRTNMAPLASFVGTANIFGLPFLFRSSDHLHRILDGQIGENICIVSNPMVSSDSHFLNLEQGRFTPSGGQFKRLTTSKGYVFDCSSQTSWLRCSSLSAQNQSYSLIPAPRPH